jgi:hypothetical protein
VTLAASPTSILYGGTVQLSGRLQQASTAEGIAGETLALERRPKGGASWTVLATVTTGGDSTLDPTQAVTPQAYTDYRLHHAATPFYAASTSQTRTVWVGVRLTARSNRIHMALCRTATISGQVVPAHPRPAHPPATQAGPDLANHPGQDPASLGPLLLQSATPGHRDQRVAHLQGQRHRPHRRHQPHLPARRLPSRHHRHPRRRRRR